MKNQEEKKYSNPQDTSGSGFFSDTFKVLFATGISQFVIVLSSPILTRLFPPESFGIFSVFNSINSIVKRNIVSRLRPSYYAT